ncbi:MAG: hypothetical protein H6918_01075 [Sphingomonadaceae bacterium]|nr:hypothetical protein [Sphingomonadaceae bacterium]
MAKGIVVELQKECLDESASITSILRKARLIATKLGLDDLTDWIVQETDGYKCSPNELPSHRKGAGQPKFFNPYNGWRPIQTSDDWFGEQLHTVYLFQPVSGGVSPLHRYRLDSSAPHIGARLALNAIEHVITYCMIHKSAPESLHHCRFP